ncbi:hypothetical protein BH23ACT9_BH23ACT9_31330 [soil metagenome]
MQIEGLADLTLVGQGGFGTVYRAWQQDFGRDVAVKVLPVSLTDERSLSRFERERQALGRLSGHPHIVAVYDHGVLADGSPYLVMEYAAAGSLADLVAREGPVLWPTVVGFGVQICSALEAAHEAGVLHRDVKPENILLTGGGRPKLADFGIARLSDRTSTQTTSVTASLMHAAPELIDGADPSVATDLYALGSTLFTMLAARPPFAAEQGTTMPALLARIVLQPPPDLRTIGVPHPVAAVIEQMLAKDPSDRPASARQAAALLQHAQQASGMPATAVPGTSLAEAPATVRGLLPPPAGPTTGPTPAPAARSRRAMAFALLSVIGAIGVGGGLLLASLLGGDGTVDTTLPEVAAEEPTADPASAPPEATPAGTPTTTPSTASATPTPAPTATPTPAPTPTPLPATGPLSPVAVTATSQSADGVNAGGQTTTFGPANLVDGDPSTAWRTPGDGVGEQIQVTFPQVVDLTAVTIATGYDKIDPFDGADRWVENRRVLRVRLTAGDGSSTVVQLDDARAPQTLDTPALGPTASLTIEILQSTGHGGRDFAAISEIAFTGR